VDTDVVIAGGGPVGLMLASELRLQGVRTVVLERLAEPTRQSRALSLHVRTAQTLDRRGLLDRFLRAQTEAAGNSTGKRRNTSHFAGLPGIDFGTLDTDVPHLSFLPQTITERILGERALELGADVRRSREIVDFTQGDDYVTARDNRGGQYTASFLIGCDGGGSTVRKLAEIDFPGTAASISGITGELVLTDPGNAPIGWRRTRRGWTLILPYPGSRISRVVAIDFSGPRAGREAGTTLDELSTTIRQILGFDVPMAEPLWLSPFSDVSRLAASYRRDRVFLAGDAAHVHFPVGGPGLNIGLQDAVNLGWKLAAQVLGWAPPGLLDTYEAERRPVAEQVLRNTRAQLALMRTDEGIDPLRDLFGELMELDQVRHLLTEMASGFHVRYELPGRQPASLIGRFAPDLVLHTPDGRRRLAELLHTGRPVLLILGDHPALAAELDGRRTLVDVVTARCDDRKDIEAMLIRPDGYTAWAMSTDDDPSGGRHDLRAALRGLIGEPAGRKENR
jgi:2-polyprenyl-6-methoxyphenol hydroxylase-like FAD-dependent oxidoreductase